MGDIKRARAGTKEQHYELSQFESAFLKALITGRNGAYNAYQAAIQAYLSQLGVEKMGIVDPAAVEFSADLETGIISATPVKKS